MNVVRFNPFNEIDRLHREMNRLFDGAPGRWSDRDAEASTHTWAPAVDIVENEDGTEIHVELPGLRRDDVEVGIENNVLTIRGERSREASTSDESLVRVERSFGRFSRSFSLPNTLDVDRAEAEMDAGVLKIRFPKREEARPKQLEIKVS
jgi:HSP20 family protein